VPTYDYKCASCDHQYEMRESFDAPPRQDCPRCGGVAKRVLHPPPIVFKGSGWYITDSRKGSSATLADGPDSASMPAPPKSDGEKPAETKPAATSSTASDD
jgi:putative FmdB family regulatory protein